MYKEFYSGMEWSLLPIVTLFFFLGAFALMLLRTFAYKKKHDFDSVAALPLDDENPTPAREVNP